MEPSKNINFFTIAQKIHFRGKSLCGKKKKLIPLHFQYFHGNFWLWKNVDLYTFWRGSEQVYVLYTCETLTFLDGYTLPPHPRWPQVKVVMNSFI